MTVQFVVGSIAFVMVTIIALVDCICRVAYIRIGALDAHEDKSERTFREVLMTAFLLILAIGVWNVAVNMLDEGVPADFATDRSLAVLIALALAASFSAVQVGFLVRSIFRLKRAKQNAAVVADRSSAHTPSNVLS